MAPDGAIFIYLPLYTITGLNSFFNVLGCI